jgi:hypothetical protein
MCGMMFSAASTMTTAHKVSQHHSDGTSRRNPNTILLYVANQPLDLNHTVGRVNCNIPANRFKYLSEGTLGYFPVLRR